MAERKLPFWATDDLADIGNGDPNKADPGAAKQDAGWTVEKPLLQTMNWIQNLFGHFISANNQFRKKATTYEAESGELILADNTSSSATILLPEFPISGQWVKVGGEIAYSLNSVIVDGNGADIMEVGESNMVLDMDDIIFLFRWDEEDSLWKVNLSLVQGAI